MIRIGFGPYNLEFKTGAGNLSRILLEKFGKHRVTGAPDLAFEIVLDKTPPAVAVRDISIAQLSSMDVVGRGFAFAYDIVRGEFKNERSCLLWVKKEAFESHWCSLFDVFLTRCFYYLERLEESGVLSHCISHASAVKRKGRGFWFPAPSETGKTTVAALLDTGTVLQDEAVLVSGPEWMLESTPLTGKFPGYENSRAALDAFFILKQDKKACVKPMKRFVAYNWLFRQLIVPLTLRDNDMRKGFELMDRFCYDLVSAIPCFELAFAKNPSFWQALDAAGVG